MSLPASLASPPPRFQCGQPAPRPLQRGRPLPRQQHRGAAALACSGGAIARRAIEVHAAPQAEPLQRASVEAPSTTGAQEPAPEPPAPPPAPPVRAVRQTELQQVATLRAEAYYEDDRSRFADSFKRQFAAQEVQSLQQRTQTSPGARGPQCECMVALDAAGSVIGCIDIRVPEAASGVRPSGVPPEEPRGAYLLNVVVAEQWRGRGIGRALMRAAMSRAVHAWGAERLFTHVQADNEVACRLYQGCGFGEQSAEAKYDSAVSLGRLVLLCAEASDVVPPTPPSE